MPHRVRLSFRATLAAIAGGALALRVVFILVTEGNSPPTGDAVYFYGQGRAVGAGLGFIDPVIQQAVGLNIQAAHHPPLYPVFLALASKLVGVSPEWLRIASACAGVAAVVVIGLVGRRASGERAGLVAAGVAAVYPNVWANDGLLLSEPLYALTIALVLLTSYRLWDDPRPREACFLGAAIGFAALTRAEAMLLVLILALPLVVVCRMIDRRQKLVLASIVVVSYGLVVAPWVMHNLYRFSEPVTISYGLAGVLPQANCDQTYYGEYLGYWHPDCSFLEDTLTFAEKRECLQSRQRCADIYLARFSDESQVAAIGQRMGLDYIEGHRGRVPVVVAARVGRMWGLFRPAQQLRIDAVGEGRGVWVPRVALVAFYELVAVGVVGLVWLRRRGALILPLLAMPILVTVVAAIAIPVTRYRMPVEVALCVLAGVVVDEVLRRGRRRSSASG